jgi:hypothetical protein
MVGALRAPSHCPQFFVGDTPTPPSPVPPDVQSRVVTSDPTAPWRVQALPRRTSSVGRITAEGSSPEIAASSSRTISLLIL